MVWYLKPLKLYSQCVSYLQTNSITAVAVPVCMLNTEQLLKVYGYEVAVFAMGYSGNLDTFWKSYFPGNMSRFMAFTQPFRVA